MLCKPCWSYFASVLLYLIFKGIKNDEIDDDVHDDDNDNKNDDEDDDADDDDNDVNVIVAVDCGLLPVVVNARLTPAGATVYGSQATYECNHGNWFSRGVFVITMSCTEEGMWTNLDAACRRTLFIACIFNFLFSFIHRFSQKKK